MTLDLNVDSEPTRAQRWTELVFHVFLRLLAVAFLGFTLQTWMQVIGFWDGANNRFDTMSTTWKIYIALLAVLHPVASVGLWTTLSWGRVIWFIAIAVQFVAFLSFSTELGENWPVFYFHLGSLAIYVIFMLTQRVIDKKT